MEQRFCCRHILRDINKYGAGPAGRGDVKSLFDGLGEISYIFDQEVVFHAWTSNADGVALLKCVLANGVRGHLPGDDNHWNGIHIGGCDAGNGVGDPRTRGHKCNARLTRGAGVGVGSVERCLLVTYQNMRERLLFVNFVVNDQHGPARIAEQKFDALGFKCAANDFGTTQHLS